MDLNTEKFLAAVKAAGKAVKKGQIEALKITADGTDAITVKGVCGQMSVCARVPATGLDSFKEAFVDPMKIMGFLQAASPETTTVRVGRVFSLTSGKMKLALPLLAQVAWTDLAVTQDCKAQATLGLADLKEKVAGVIHACDQTSAEMRGCVHVVSAGREVRVEAMDSARACIRGFIPKDAKKAEIVVNAQALTTALSLLKGESVEVKDFGTRLLMKGEDIEVLLTKNFDEFFNLTKVMSMPRKDITLAREPFLNIIEAACLVDKKVQLTGKAREAIQVCAEEQTGRFEAALDESAGFDFVIAFNGLLLREAVKSFADPSFTLGICGGGKAAYIIPANTVGIDMLAAVRAVSADSAKAAKAD